MRTAALDEGDILHRAHALGLQLVPKGSGAADKGSAAQVNPLVSLVPDPTQVDYSLWRAVTASESKQRAARLAARRDMLRAAPVEPLLVDEAEPDAVRGGNDTTANAQLIPQFGTASTRRPAARILGTLAPVPTPSSMAPVPEENGSIPLAGETGLTRGSAVRTSGVIGDGAHGTAGDGRGDFDFYAVRGVVGGQRLVVDVDTPTGNLDSVVLLYDATGALIALNDDSTQGLDSLLDTRFPVAGDYFVAIAGFTSMPRDPFDPGSGTGAGREGPYDVELSLDARDVDVYAVDLRAGDVVGGSVTGAATRLTVLDAAARDVHGSEQDASVLYPVASPLPGGGTAVVDHVAAASGRHYVAVAGGAGTYDATLEVYRPGAQTRNVTQTIFLDFDGARVNTGVYGGPGVRTLSPLPAFLGLWGIPGSEEDALIDRVVATVRENLRDDLAGQGVRVVIRNSRDHADPFGQPNVSRLVVGGTIAESGLSTIGIAQSIDPGNFELEETGLVLLDVVSAPPPRTASFNTYLRPESDPVRFVGTALGNIAAHEAGHYLGNWHVDAFNDVLNVMDRGGNYALLYGVGPDGVGGTADDPDVDFGEDRFAPIEGFTGIQDTAARIRWGLHR